MFGELEIGDRIDEQIAQDFEERNVSVGQAVKALVLTGLGFVQQRLYLTAQFFEEFEAGLKASEFTKKRVQRAPRYMLEESSSPDGEGNQLKETGEVEWLVAGTLVPFEEQKARLLKKKSFLSLRPTESITSKR